MRKTIKDTTKDKTVVRTSLNGEVWVTFDVGYNCLSMIYTPAQARKVIKAMEQALKEIEGD